MKIFIIGPEGAGKTVLLAMLSRYIATERKDLVLEPVDRIAAQYVITALEILEKGDWPPSTRQAELPTLRWRFGLRSEPLHEIVVFDAAGQDLRQILVQDDPTKLGEKQRFIRAQIDAADVLVYLIDLNGFLGTKDLKIRDENAWLFKTFLKRPEWCGKRRLVVLSKADIYADMLESLTSQGSKDASVRELVKRHLPKDYTLDHLVDEEGAVNYFAVASVATCTVIDSAGKPVRLPKVPLEPVGIGEFVDAVVEESSVIRRKKSSAVLNRRAKMTCIALAIVGLCWGLFHPVPCRFCQATGGIIETRICSACKGEGTVPGMIWGRNSCDACKQSGRVRIPVTCTACNGSLKTSWYK
jgi:GTPase SAR1 family protein